jgi:YVTN family beta-propeller protein
VMKLLRNRSSALKYWGLLFALPLYASSLRVYITNAAGDRVHVIDPETNKVVDEIKGIEIPSGVDFSHDGKTIYFSCEGEKTLDFVERATGKIVGKAPLTGRPNSISTSPDGKLVFVAIAQAPGGVDVVDVASMKRIKTVPVKGAVHYAYLTPDGKYIAATSIPGKIITIVDVNTLEPLWDFNFKQGVRPVAFEKGPDGLTSRMFVQESGLHGFEVVDFKTRQSLTTITLPNEPISLVGMPNQPFSKIDQMAALQRGTQFPVLQPSAEDIEDYLLSIFHFETVCERAFMRRPIAKNVCDRVAYAVAVRCRIEDLW